MTPEDYIPMCIRQNCEGQGLYIMDIEEDDGSLYEEFECQVCGAVWHEVIIPEPKGALADDPNEGKS